MSERVISIDQIDRLSTLLAQTRAVAIVLSGNVEEEGLDRPNDEIVRDSLLVIQSIVESCQQEIQEIDKTNAGRAITSISESFVYDPDELRGFINQVSGLIKKEDYETSIGLLDEFIDQMDHPKTGQELKERKQGEPS